MAWGSVWFAGGLVFFLTWGLIDTARRSRLDVWGTLEAWYSIFWYAGTTAVVGGVTGGVFAAYIATNFRNRRLQDLSPTRFALGGGLVAILLRLLLVSAEIIGAGHELRHINLEWLWPSLAYLGVAGAVTGFASLKLAQRGELAGGEETGRLGAESTTLLPEP